MDSSEILIEILAIKLFEHEPLASGEINRLSWNEAEFKDQDHWRKKILQAQSAKELYDWPAPMPRSPIER